MKVKYNSWIHIFFSVVALIATLLAIIVTFLVVNNVLGKGCDVDAGCQSMMFLATTFMSSRRIETSMGFPVATERDLTRTTQLAFNDPASPTRDRAYQFGHFIECMYTARMADRTCNPGLSMNDYAACVQNTTLIVGGLAACATFPSVGGYSHWPTAEEYVACVTNNPLLQNSESRRASQNVFRACVEQTLWPFFEVPQNMDSPVLFGSFNWGMLLLAGIVVLSSFLVYTSSPIETGQVDRGEVRYFMRLGFASSFVAFAWNAAFFFVFVLAAFRNSGEFQGNGGLPTTFSTSMATILVSGAATLYFLAIVLAPVGRKFVAVARSATGSVAAIEAVPLKTETNDHERQSLLQSTLPSLAPGQHVTYDVKTRQPNNLKYELTKEQVARMYTPPLLAIWSDSYLADFCFVLGVAGATGQLATDAAYNLFALTFAYRLLNMIISRCMSDAFTNNVRLEDVTNAVKNSIVTRPETWWQRAAGYSRVKNEKDVHINTKVIGLSTQLSALCVFIAIFYLVFSDSAPFGDYAIFRNFMILGFIIPELFRLFIHVGYQLCYNGETMGSVPWVLYNLSYFVWLWDAVARVVVVFVVMVDSSGMPGTFDFLRSQTALVMRDYIRVMAV